jgi:hypothetical protein
VVHGPHLKLPEQLPGTPRARLGLRLRYHLRRPIRLGLGVVTLTLTTDNRVGGKEWARSDRLPVVGRTATSGAATAWAVLTHITTIKPPMHEQVPSRPSWAAASWAPPLSSIVLVHGGLLLLGSPRGQVRSGGLRCGCICRRVVHWTRARGTNNTLSSRQG